MKIAFDNKDFFSLVRETLEVNQNISFVIKGTSMKPFFIDMVTEVFIKKKITYKKYDICLFEYNNQILLHRLIKIKDKYIFKGDNSSNTEEVDETDILAYVYKFSNNNKTVDVRSFKYKLRVRLFLMFKVIKNIVKKVIK